MKTISERAAEYITSREGTTNPSTLLNMKDAYVDGATEQLLIDEQFYTSEMFRKDRELAEEISKLNQVWVERIRRQRAMMANRAAIAYCSLCTARMACERVGDTCWDMLKMRKAMEE